MLHDIPLYKFNVDTRLAVHMDIHGYIHGYIHVWISDLSHPVDIQALFLYKISLSVVPTLHFLVYLCYPVK